MTVALGTTLIAKKIHNLDKEGGWQRIEPAITTSTDIFIGAGVTRKGMTGQYIDLCAETEALLGFVLGYNTALETIDDEGYYYRDYDNPFISAKNVLVGVPKHGGIYLILSGTQKTIALFDRINCVDGVWEACATSDNFQMIAEEAVAGASNVRKYFYARWVKN